VSDDERLCPSARCEPGAILLGIVGADGVVGYVRPQIDVDEEFVATAHQGRSPEKRFRFASRCVEAKCMQWTGSRCGVIDKVLDRQERGELPAAELPACTIRQECRWYAQSGSRACTVCPFVVTDTLPDGTTMREVQLPAGAELPVGEAVPAT
jgi:hypothetical protein